MSKRAAPERATVFLHRLAPSLAGELKRILGRRYLTATVAARKEADEDGETYDNALTIDGAVEVDWLDLSPDARTRLVAAGMKEGDFEVDVADFHMDTFYSEGRTAGVEFLIGKTTTRVNEADLMRAAPALKRDASEHGHWEVAGTGKNFHKIWVGVKPIN